MPLHCGAWGPVREVGVVAVENAQLLQEFVVAGVEPVHLVAPGAAGVGQHERVAAVGLGLTRGRGRQHGA